MDASKRERFGEPLGAGHSVRIGESSVVEPSYGGRFMRRAHELAEKGRYTAAPNPLVGAVVTHDGKVIGEGYHARTGEEHAEIAALRDCGVAAHGAEMYATLEPCNHHGRTPPCVDAIVAAGISRVVVGYLDPDPRMRGRSVRMLRRAGIEVEVLEDPIFEKQNEQFFHLMRTGRPFVHLKIAATLDGRIATAGGDSRWVTGEAARRRVHLLRAESGAVLAGAGTVRTDDPLLTARGLAEKPPEITRVVLDPAVTISAESMLCRTARDLPVLLFADASLLDDCGVALREKGLEVIPAPAVRRDLDLEFVLEYLGRRGIRGLLVEGGGVTAGRFMRSGFVDKLTVFYAPKVVGGDGLPMVGPLGVSHMADASGFRLESVERLEEDVALTFYPLTKMEETDVHRAG